MKFLFKIIFVFIFIPTLWKNNNWVSSNNYAAEKYELLCIDIGIKINTEDFSKCVKEAKIIEKEILLQEQKNEIDNYKTLIRKKIQTATIKSYPKKLLRRNIAGKVDLIFTLNFDGSLFNITPGSNINIDKDLIDAAIKTLKLSAPFPANDILKVQNKFSISIMFKIN